MNIFVLDTDPRAAARMMCDKHIPKMLVESAQMMASALRRHGLGDEDLPLTRRGTPYKMAYPNHPCTKWVGDSYQNFMWLYQHAETISQEYFKRFGKRRGTHRTIRTIREIHQTFDKHFPTFDFPEDGLTPFALAVNRKKDIELIVHAEGNDAVKAYRAYYHSKTFAKWDKGTPAPNWWQGVTA